MLKFTAAAKLYLWEFVEIAFLAVLALLLISILLGPGAGSYVASVTENATKFAAAASPGVLGVVIVLAIIFLVLRRNIGTRRR
jgi:nitrate reductase gamma subunit